MRLIGLLVVVALLGWLGAHAVRPSHRHDAQQVVNGARSDLQRAEAQQQAAQDRQLQGADAP